MEAITAVKAAADLTRGDVLYRNGETVTEAYYDMINGVEKVVVRYTSGFGSYFLADDDVLIEA
jgi:hypothetical protein